MSFTRQQRRRMARDLAKTGNIEQGLQAIEQRAIQATDSAIDEIQREHIERTKGEMQGQMFTLVLAYARIKRGFGKKRLLELAEEFFVFCDDMMINQVQIQDLFDMIKDETGIDCDVLYKRLDKGHIARLQAKGIKVK